MRVQKAEKEAGHNAAEEHKEKYNLQYTENKFHYLVPVNNVSIYLSGSSGREYWKDSFRSFRCQLFFTHSHTWNYYLCNQRMLKGAE